MVTMNIKKGTYKYGIHQGNGWTMAFNTSNCECCSNAILGANSINIATADIGPLGLEIVKALPEDGGYSEAFGGETCLGCDEHTTPCYVPCKCNHTKAQQEGMEECEVCNSGDCLK